MKKNIGSHIILSIIFIFFIGLIAFIAKGFNNLKDKIQIVIKTSTENKLIQFNKKETNNQKKKRQNIIEQNKNQILKTNINQKDNIISIDKKSKNKKKMGKTKSIDLLNSKSSKRQNNKKNQIIKSQNRNNFNLLKRKNNQQNKKNNNNQNITNNKKIINNNNNNKNGNKNINNIKYNDSDLNSFDYINAQKFDKRDYPEYYFSLIKTRHPLISSFCPNDGYNSMSIKICLFFFSFSLSFLVNSLFFTDETMHKIYEDEGLFNFIYSLPKIIYSTIISTVIGFAINKLALSENSILDIRQEKTLQDMKLKAEKTKRNLVIKISFFFFFGFVLLGGFWFYIGCFCAVYTNTQLYLIKDTLISFAFSLAFPFIQYFLPCIIRGKSLKKPGKCLYDMSKICQ